jgi:imidazoleglycerol-phosphate dehydratase
MKTNKTERNTSETQIKMEMNVYGTGKAEIKSDIGFLNHMLETFSKHGLFDLKANIKGDLHVDQHHTIEDTGIVLGETFKTALGDKRGIKRNGFCIYPMDEALVMTALDISGRPFLKFDAPFKTKMAGDLHTDVVEEFFQGFVSALGATLHIKVYYGRSDHHKIEAIFKSFAKSLKMAVEIEPRVKNKIPSTKGVL